MPLPTKFQLIWLSSFKGEFFFRDRPIKNKNCMWWPCLLTDRDEMSNLHRGHSIDDSYQVSVVVVLSKECTFCYDPLPNMATTGNSSF
jgi:Zn-finger protein